MTVIAILNELEALGSEQTLKTFRTHGAPANCYGVKIGDLKKHLLKKVKRNQQLCLALFATGNSDAQYLAGLGVIPDKLTKEEIRLWLNQSCWSAIDETIVSGIAAESRFALALAKEWLNQSDMRKENVGWLTYAKYIAQTPDDTLSKNEITQLLQRIKKEIHTAPNSIRYSMNQFIIYVGVYYPELTPLASKVARDIQQVEIKLPTKGCKLPDPLIKIQKAKDTNRLGVKRQKIIC